MGVDFVLFVEFVLINCICVCICECVDVVLGIGDDVVLLQLCVGEQFVVIVDIFNSGVYFFVEILVGDIGWKILVVNFFDLVLMGVCLVWCMLVLLLFDVIMDWIDVFVEGFFVLVDVYDIVLIGGDIICGLLLLLVIVMGQVLVGIVLCCDVVQVGDDIWVSGIFGDVVGVLCVWQVGMFDVCQFYVDFWWEVLCLCLVWFILCVVLGCVLVGLVYVVVDVFDGLIVDLGYICVCSGFGVQFDVIVLLLLDVLCGFFVDVDVCQCVLCGGDDYELCFIVVFVWCDVLVVLVVQLQFWLICIGIIIDGQGVVCDGDDVGVGGYQYFG